MNLLRGAIKGYCVDANCFIALRRHYAREVFPDIWTGLEDLCHRGLLISPRQVLTEVAAGNDEVATWITTLERLVPDADDSLNVSMELVMRHCWKMLNPKRDKDTADPHRH